MFTTHDWEWFIYTTYKNGDDWGMVYCCFTHIAVAIRIESFRVGLPLKIPWDWCYDHPPDNLIDNSW